MEAGFQGNLTTNFVIQNALIIAVAMVIRFIFFGSSGVASHKGAYGALFKVRCMVVNHMAKVPLGALNERSTGNIKTVLNEDIEKLELFLAHNLPELVYYMIGPIAVFFYLLTVNIHLALVSLVPLIVAMITMAVLFRNMDEMMGRANKSIMSLNSIMIEYISGMMMEGFEPPALANLRISREAETTPALTVREEQIISLCAEGMLDRDIAERLGISEATIRKHMQSILRKLNCKTSRQAVALWVRSNAL